jgi:hypothetical protein
MNETPLYALNLFGLAENDLYLRYQGFAGE